ncbi:uncharacterized protein [Anabrus simplex]|uniref:uncharacterized protein n=1 Tax=Anabrus simplex TaxID=316456 RepID=UPI0035A278F2
MSEADYEYEVMRCELLGLPPPERQPLPPKSSKDEEGEDFHVDEESIEADQQVEVESEQLKNTSGRLDELNSILNVTQKKLNRFKAVCGSLTNLLKIRVPSSGKDTASSSNLSSRASIASNTEGEAAPSSDDTGMLTA